MYSKTIGNPPECSPFAEQAEDEVGKAFDVLTLDLMDALDASMPPGWYAAAQDAWCAIRAKELEAEYEEARAERDEP